MMSGASFRGQPLFALFAVLGCWVALRAALWDADALAPVSLPEMDVPARFADEPLGGNKPDRSVAHGGEQGGRLKRDSGAGDRPARRDRSFRIAPGAAAWPRSASDLRRPARRFLTQSGYAGVGHLSAGPGNVPVRIAAAHQMLRMAMLARVPLPMSLAGPVAGAAAAPFYPIAREPLHGRRWSADGWLLLRRGGNVSLATGSAPSTYGASQAGAVLRYRIAPANGHRPAAYLRTTAALNGSGEREAALGLSARPLPRVPVAASAELRATDQSGSTRLRPAAFLVTELEPFVLPFGGQAEAYGQAGYVGGKFSTGFVDGHLRADRAVARLGKAQLRAGAGVWGGAQKGASRLDIGPAATMGMALGQSGSARLAVDWRFRVAGNAAPSSGPALTLSAGF